MTVAFDLESVDFAKGGGTITVVAQDADSGAVLMVAAADREALAQTVATGEMYFRSRTRGLWHKGATSGNVQRVVSLALDCDADAVLARVRSAGPACHTGAVSCFGEDALNADVLARLDATIAARHRGGDDERSYTRKLLGDRNLRLKKLGEEAAELVVASADSDGPRAVSEAADLLYHALVALRACGVGLAEIRATLRDREG